MTDWKKNLSLLAEKVRQDQKRKKTIKNKHDLEENFKGRKGFNDTGIALTEKTIKQQRKNKLAYGTSIKIGNNKNIYYDGGAPVDDESIEPDPYAVDAACSSVIDQDPQFKNKVEEEIWRLKNERRKNGNNWKEVSHIESKRRANS